MKRKKIEVVFAGAVLVLTMLVAGCSSGQTTQSQSDSSQSSQTQATQTQAEQSSNQAAAASKQEGSFESAVAYNLYFGMNDKDTGTQVLATDTAKQTIRKIITDMGLGYTEFDAYGGYVAGSSVMENETIGYLICAANEEQIMQIANQGLDELNTSAVLVTSGQIEKQLVSRS